MGILILQVQKFDFLPTHGWTDQGRLICVNYIHTKLIYKPKFQLIDLYLDTYQAQSSNRGIICTGCYKMVCYYYHYNCYFIIITATINIKKDQLTRIRTHVVWTVLMTYWQIILQLSISNLNFYFFFFIKAIHIIVENWENTDKPTAKQNKTITTKIIRNPTTQRLFLLTFWCIFFHYYLQSVHQNVVSTVWAHCMSSLIFCLFT